MEELSVKISLLTKAIYRFNAITVKIPVAFIFIEIGKINPKIHMEHTHTPQIARERKQSWKHHTSWFQNILQNYSNQNSMVLA